MYKNELDFYDIRYIPFINIFTGFCFTKQMFFYETLYIYKCIFISEEIKYYPNISVCPYDRWAPGEANPGLLRILKV